MFHNVVIGSVLDVRGGVIQQALKRYDDQLEVKWSPKKGMWEVWRRPTKKTAVYQGEITPGNGLYTIEYVYSNFTHHILDAAVLDWRIVDRIKSMDTQCDKNWVSKMEYESDLIAQKKKEDNRKELKYAIKQHSKIFREWATNVSFGQNPGRVLSKLKMD